LQAIGPQYAQDWITRFGFEAEKHPAYLTMALGAGSVTPMQMATAYSVFANGGYRINPWLVSKVTEQQGKLLAQARPPELDESNRAIDPRNAFIMSNLLQEVTRTGTAARAQATLKRPDVYGKTGTTNDSMDAWFAGFQPTLMAVTWIGYDSPRKLGDKETGGGLSLPVWITYMEHALKNVPVAELSPTEGIVRVGNEWFYDEYAGEGGIKSLGLDEPTAAEEAPASAPLPAPAPAPVAAPVPAPVQVPPQAEERNKILDLFKN
jgi:penicillin-binding protein 1A